MSNEILLKRICQLIAMNYATSVDKVWELYLKTNSIDKTLETILEQK